MDMLNYGNANKNKLTTGQWLSDNEGNRRISEGKDTLIENIRNSKAGIGRVDPLAIADDVAFALVAGTIVYLAATNGNKDSVASGFIDSVTTAFQEANNKLSGLLKLPGYSLYKPDAKGNFLPNVAARVDNNPVDVYPAQERKPTVEIVKPVEEQKPNIMVTPVEVSKPRILMSKTEEEKVAKKILEEFIAKEKRLSKVIKQIHVKEVSRDGRTIEKPHIHFKWRRKLAMNLDGTMKHGTVEELEKVLTGEIKELIRKHGGKLPPGIE
jgi:hypothetical protein